MNPVNNLKKLLISTALTLTFIMTIPSSVLSMEEHELEEIGNIKQRILPVRFTGEGEDPILKHGTQDFTLSPEEDNAYQQEGAQVNLHSMTQNDDKEKPETSAETPLEPAPILNSNGQTMSKTSSENGPKVSFPSLPGTTEDEPDLKTAQLLFQCPNKHYKRIGKSRLLSLVEEINMNGADAATFLFKNADNEETKNIARETLYSILNRPEAYYRAPSEDVYTDQLLLKLKTAITLIEKGSEQDKSVGDKAIQGAYHHAFILERSKCLRSLWIIAGNLEDSHLVGIYAYEYLLSCGVDERYAENSLCQIAQKEGHPHQYIAAKILYKKSKYSSSLAEKVLRFIANQKNHPHQNEAKEALSFCILM